MQADWIIHNVNLATMRESTGVPYGKIENALLAIHNGSIAWLGKEQKAPKFENAKKIDGQNGWLTPGLIDCHTHIIYAGNRAGEFSGRLQGESYEEMTIKGGGINSTVRATRQASTQTLLNSATKRLKNFLREGVTTIEIKSGYGLDLDTEIRLLEVAKQLSVQQAINVSATFLGAHAVPCDYKNCADDYIDFVCDQVIPIVVEKKLADAVDVFCENVGFNLSQCRKIFLTAKKFGLPIKAHAEQLSYLGGAKLVAEFSGLSVDHVEFLSDEDIPQLKENDVVAVLLPSAFYFLQGTQRPPIAAMREANLPMAVASDCNPGSAPMASLLLAMNQACVLFRLTPEEALRGVTWAAAKALNLQCCKGQLTIGWDADLALWDIQHPDELSYAINMHTPTSVWFGGKHFTAR